MLTWLRTRPAGTRRAARPANPVNSVPKNRPVPPQVEEDMPPPFFADEDTAFLDMGEERLTPPPLPQSARSVRQAAGSEFANQDSAESRLATALLALPSFPERRDPERMRQLLDIFRSLDRIAGAACDGISTCSNSR